MTYNYDKNSWMVAIYYTDAQGHRHHLTKRGFKSKDDAKNYEDAFLLKTQHAQKNGG